MDFSDYSWIFIVIGLLGLLAVPVISGPIRRAVRKEAKKEKAKRNNLVAEIGLSNAAQDRILGRNGKYYDLDDFDYDVGSHEFVSKDKGNADTG